MNLGVPPSDSIPRLKLAFIQFVAGGTSSMIEVGLLQPFDVIKTRLQMQKHSNRNGAVHYTGVIDAFIKIYQQEGIKAYWRGIIPPLISDTPRRAIKFLIYEQSKPYYQLGADKPNVLTYMLAGGTAGAIEGAIQSPFELIKIVQQTTHKRSPNTFEVIREVINTGGLTKDGVFRGLTATMLRNSLFHMFWFSIFSFGKDQTKQFEVGKWEFVRSFTISFLSGLLSTIAVCPLDVAKTRIQGPQPVKGQVKYRKPLTTVVTVFKEEGLLALYSGLVPQMMRAGPASVILLMGYDYVFNLLKK